MGEEAIWDEMLFFILGGAGDHPRFSSLHPSQRKSACS